MTESDEKLRDYLKRVTADLRRTRRRLQETRRPGSRADRDRRDELPLSPGACARRRSCGSWSPRGGRRDRRRFPPIAAGTWRRSVRPRSRPSRDELCARWRLRRRGRRVRRRTSSGSARGRRWRWTLSSGCCWKRAWEALEDGGIDPASLRGSQTGVFAGLSFSRYGGGVRSGHRPAIEGYRADGQPPAASPRAGSPTRLVWRGRRCRSTRRAPRRWWRCTWRARRCARGSARWRWRAE